MTKTFSKVKSRTRCIRLRRRQGQAGMFEAPFCMQLFGTTSSRLNGPGRGFIFEVGVMVF